MTAEPNLLLHNNVNEIFYLCKCLRNSRFFSLPSICRRRFHNISADDICCETLHKNFFRFDFARELSSLIFLTRGRRVKFGGSGEFSVFFHEICREIFHESDIFIAGANLAERMQHEGFARRSALLLRNC